jgi:hypothetical protein
MNSDYLTNKGAGSSKQLIRVGESMRKELLRSLRGERGKNKLGDSRSKETGRIRLLLRMIFNYLILKILLRFIPICPMLDPNSEIGSKTTIRGSNHKWEIILCFKAKSSRDF